MILLRVREELNIPRGPLELITPNFEAALPKLQPAVFEPQFIDLDEPALELFDLDTDLSDDTVKLAEAANKCKAVNAKISRARIFPSDKDHNLDQFIIECGQISGISLQLPENEQKVPKKILQHLVRQLIKFKSANFVSLSCENGFGIKGYNSQGSDEVERKGSSDFGSEWM